MNSMQRELLLVLWVENFLVLAAVVSLCFMCNRNGRTLFVGRCGISYIFRFSLKMAVHG